MDRCRNGILLKSLPWAKDYAGKRFGRLVAIKCVGQEKVSHNLLWKCHCDCGKFSVVRSRELSTGNTISCGCARRAPDISGKRFGRLVVIRRYKPSSSPPVWLCLCDCGKKKKVKGYHLGKVTNSCGCLRDERHHLTGPLAAGWKGGKFNVGGYVLVYDPQHPNGNGDNHVREHVKIMAEIIGRPLRKGEIVHHKNGIRSDNRPENLELHLRSAHPIGQRVEDIVRFSLDIVDKYPDVVEKIKLEGR